MKADNQNKNFGTRGDEKDDKRDKFNDKSGSANKGSSDVSADEDTKSTKKDTYKNVEKGDYEGYTSNEYNDEKRYDNNAILGDRKSGMEDEHNV